MEAPRESMVVKAKGADPHNFQVDPLMRESIRLEDKPIIKKKKNCGC